ncbi:MAG: aminoglycoside phosphotransferase family protein [Desulfomonilaceae bacterium]
MIENSDVLNRIEKAALYVGSLVAIEPLAGDASTRTYFRLIFQDNRSAIAMVMPNPGDNEESTFVEIQQYLENLETPVPRIFFHDPTSGILILEDLGDGLLEHLAANVDASGLKSLYELAVDTLVLFQKNVLKSNCRCSAFSLVFDEAKLMWEMDFFLTHFVRGWARKTPSLAASRQINSFFRKICLELASEPRLLTHRDYHSRNLIMKNGLLYMIDFQDARMGPAQYDLASLLRDSYLSLPEDLVDNLVYRYFENSDHLLNRNYDYFRRIFDLMSLQRNIKALGTFGYQISVKDASRYLSAIPRTVINISLNLNKYPEFGVYLSVLEDLIIAPVASLILINK